ncbi:EAL domain-containing protein, partial [Candidatus Saccharibacteria bacterium]|nr:EAL domain-containing protein [Candidatus Saccharibacteria bacterium]
FMPHALKQNIIYDIDHWVINRSMQLLEALNEDVCFNINLALNTQTGHELTAFIDQQLKYYNLLPERLTFEFKEPKDDTQFQQCEQLSYHLRQKGCHIAIDNFGQNFGIYKSLKDIPADNIKISGDFFNYLAPENNHKIFLQAIIDMAHSLAKCTTAESIETLDAYKTAQALGVDFAQGYHIGRPSTRIHDVETRHL